MLEEFIDQRLARRVLFETEIEVQQEEGTQEPFRAITYNISTSGIQFYIPKSQKVRLFPDELVELFFTLPGFGEVNCRGEICSFTTAWDDQGVQVTCYGVKYLDLAIELWYAINDFCLARFMDDPGQDNPGQFDVVDNSEPAFTESTKVSNIMSLDELNSLIAPATNYSSQRTPTPIEDSDLSNYNPEPVVSEEYPEEYSELDSINNNNPPTVPEQEEPIMIKPFNTTANPEPYFPTENNNFTDNPAEPPITALPVQNVTPIPVTPIKVTTPLDTNLSKSKPEMIKLPFDVPNPNINIVTPPSHSSISPVTAEPSPVEPIQTPVPKTTQSEIKPGDSAAKPAGSGINLPFSSNNSGKSLSQESIDQLIKLLNNQNNPEESIGGPVDLVDNKTTPTSPKVDNPPENIAGNPDKNTGSFNTPLFKEQNPVLPNGPSQPVSSFGSVDNRKVSVQPVKPNLPNKPLDFNRTVQPKSINNNKPANDASLPPMDDSLINLVLNKNNHDNSSGIPPVNSLNKPTPPPARTSPFQTAPVNLNQPDKNNTEPTQNVSPVRNQGNPLPPINKNSSFNSMNQEMIDRIVQNMSQNNGSVPPETSRPANNNPFRENRPPEPESTFKNSTVDFTKKEPRNETITVSLRRKDGKTVTSEVENLNFGGFIVRLTEEFPVNSQVTMNLISGNIHINGLEGICTNCNSSESSGRKEFLVSFCFGHLSRTHFEQLRTLITK